MIYYNGVLLRANRTEKAETSVFTGFISKIPALVRSDIDFTINTEMLGHTLRTAYIPTFYNRISDKFTLIQILPEVSSLYIDLILKDDSYQAYIIIAPFGFHNCVIGKHTLVDKLKEKIEENKIVFILTKETVAEESTIIELIKCGAIINTDITRTTLIAKMGFLLANVG